MSHQAEVASLQKQIRDYQGSALLAFKRHRGHSNTTRSKSYHHSSYLLNSSSLDKIIAIDQDNSFIRVQPKVTMEALTKSLLPLGYGISVVPEFKGITVGGAIMGAAAESGSYKHGIFSDLCLRYELISGNGDLIVATAEQNRDIFFALPGSYGSLGFLVSVDIKIIKMGQSVLVKATHFSNLGSLIKVMQKKSDCDFMDGIVFSKNHGVLVEGNLISQKRASKTLSDSPFSPWFYQFIQKEKECVMSLYEYFFRLDRGAFWMGGYLLKVSLLKRFISEGIYKLAGPEKFTASEIKEFHKIKSPSFLQRFISHYFMSSQTLWGLLHKAENWVQNRFVIQDFCIPETKAFSFLEHVMIDTEIFPLWLCPIKGTRSPQIFAPHLISLSDNNFINIGVYGMPSFDETIEDITKKLEKKTCEHGGRKVLYSRSYYSEKEFWDIYSKSEYERLRLKTSAIGRWPEITAKVLSS